jgi:Fic family protein
MAKQFNQLLASSLYLAKNVAVQQIIRSSRLARNDRERLLQAGYLQKIVRGWYLFCTPQAEDGESTPWYASFWDFIHLYLQDRFGQDYCLSAEASLALVLGKNYIPPQIVVVAKKGGMVVLKLPHNTSLLIYQENKKFPTEIVQYNGLNVLPFEYALAKMPPGFYLQQPQEAEIALRMLRSSEKILYFLLKEGMVQAASRIIGGLMHLRNEKLAHSIQHAMQAAGFSLNITNPFQEKPLLNLNIVKSPYSARVQCLWATTRGDVVKLFPKAKSSTTGRNKLLENLDHLYTQDAYHSLSIEGYQVSENLIAKIASGNWHPDKNHEDLNQKNALAAQGYYAAFKAVKKTIYSMLKSETPIKILQEQFMDWYLTLFSPAVTAGIIPASHLAGFRRQPVYIRNAMHVPPPYTAVCDCMETLWQCLAQEENGAVQAVLAHWLLGYIHPFTDGNGRMARFLMNALLVNSGYPWTIIHVEQRKNYLEALEKASIHSEIKDFCRLIIQEMSKKI